MDKLIFEALSLDYTFKCNAKCRHCIFSCTPKRSEKMPFKEAISLISDAKAAGIKEINFSGGEPFLFKDEMFPLIKEATNNNLKTLVFSNAFWASDIESAKKMVKEMVSSGLGKLKISTDKYHAQFVPITSIKNALIACEGKIDVTLCVATDSHSEYLKILSKLSPFLKNFKVELLPVIISFGRAKKFSANDLSPLKKDLSKLIPCKMRPTAVVLPNLDVYFCCYLILLNDRKSVFFLGNLAEESLTDILNRASKSPPLNYLSQFGPMKFFSKLKPEDDKLQENTIPCNFCIKSSMGNKDFLKSKECLEKMRGL